MNTATSFQVPRGKRILSACMAAVLVASLMPAAGVASATEGEASEAASGNLAAAQIPSQSTQFTTQATDNPNLTTTKINATYQQTDARRMLADINAFRTDSRNAWQYDKDNNRRDIGTASALEYDYALEQAAMIRAVEISQLFEHTRPNGQYCTSLHKTSGTHGENIAYGQGMSRERAMQLWKEEQQLYNGQGHRRNMQNKRFRYVAVAHARIGGWDYWVQEFGSEPTANYNQVTKPDDSNRDVEIEVPVSRDAVTGISDITSWAYGGWTIQIFAGESTKLVANVEPKTALNKAIKWEVTDGTVGGMPITNKDELANYFTIDADGLGVSNPNNGADSSFGIKATAVGNDACSTEAAVMVLSRARAAQMGVTLYDVNYVTGKDDMEVRSEKIRGGGILYPPMNLRAPDGSELEYWCTDAARQKPVTAQSLTVSSNMTYYAKWKPAEAPDPTPSPDPDPTPDPPATKTKLDSSAITIAPPQGAITYNGQAQKPKFTLKHGDKTLQENTDYTAQYSNNQDAGQATVEFAGMGSYEGTVKRQFTIERAPIPVPSVIARTYNGSPQTGVATGIGYTITGNTGTNASTPYRATATLDKNYRWNDNTTTDKTIPWSIAPKPLTGAQITLDKQTYTATGKAIIPAIKSVTVDGLTVPPSDYTPSCSNINPGQATVTLTGKNNFTRTASTTFTIEGIQLSATAATITGVESRINYSDNLRELIKPVVKLTDGTLLAPSTDYTVRFSNLPSTNPGANQETKATMLIEGAGIYVTPGVANQQLKFEITIVGTGSSGEETDELTVPYTGKACRPNITIKNAKGEILDKGTHYLIAYSNNVRPGTARMTIVGIGMYCGTIERTFKIERPATRNAAASTTAPSAPTTNVPTTNAVTPSTAPQPMDSSANTSARSVVDAITVATLVQRAAQTGSSFSLA